MKFALVVSGATAGALLYQWNIKSPVFPLTEADKDPFFISQLVTFESTSTFGNGIGMILAVIETLVVSEHPVTKLVAITENVDAERFPNCDPVNIDGPTGGTPLNQLNE